MTGPKRQSTKKSDAGRAEFEAHMTESPEETSQLARRFAKRLVPGDWVGLIGALGAGKSVFARAVGEEWGVQTAMSSPSYTLMNAHRGHCMIYHVDLYRVGSPDELDFAGLTQYFAGAGICLVEWPERARSVWPECGWTVNFEVTGPNTRRITIERFGT